MVISASHNPFADNGIKLFAAGGAKLGAETEAAIEDELERILDPSVKGPRRLEGHGVGQPGRRTRPGPSLRRPPGHAAGGPPPRRAPAGGRQRQRRGLGAGRPRLRAAGRRGGGHRLRARRHQHQRRVRFDVHRRPWPARWSSTGPTWGWPSTATPTGCWRSTRNGALVDGDELLALFALDLADRGQLAGNTVVVTVMTNLGFRLAMEQRGILVKETPVGDRHVLAALDKDGLRLGGEQSGHIIFRRLATTGDGLLTGLILADLVARAGKPLAELLDGLVDPGPPGAGERARSPTPSCWTGPRRCGRRWPRRRPGSATPGRVLLRPSGTEPLVRVMVEADGDGVAEAIAQRLSTLVGFELQAAAATRG